MKNNYEDFCRNLMKLNWVFKDGFDRCLLEPETYEFMLEKLSRLRINKLIEEKEADLYYEIINLGKKRYLEFLEKKTNLPRIIAQKFISKKNIRRFIFKRDNYKCLCCGSDNKLSIDHIFSIHYGGENKISNLQTLCLSCNSRKNKSYKDYRNGKVTMV